MEGGDGFMNKLSTHLFVTKVYRVLLLVLFVEIG
jgi:hypothetical protein